MRKHAAAAVAACLLLAGCGHRTAQPPLSHEAFVRAADGICTHATTRAGRAARLQALRPPAADQDLYSHWLAAERDAIAATEPRKASSGADEPDPAVALAIAEGKVAGYARRLGAGACVTMRG